MLLPYYLDAMLEKPHKPVEPETDMEGVNQLSQRGFKPPEYGVSVHSS